MTSINGDALSLIEIFPQYEDCDGAGSLHRSYDYMSVAGAPLSDWFLHKI